VQGTADDPNSKFHAVLCATCKSHVAAIDGEEVYHFFNVLDSQ
jgi:hypothetical protein